MHYFGINPRARWATKELVDFSPRHTWCCQPKRGAPHIRFVLHGVWTHTLLSALLVKLAPPSPGKYLNSLTSNKHTTVQHTQHNNKKANQLPRRDAIRSAAANASVLFLFAARVWKSLVMVPSSGMSPGSNLSIPSSSFASKSA